MRTKSSTDGWWKDNPNVKFSYNENPKNQFSKKSKVCLCVRWDSVPQNRPFAYHLKSPEISKKTSPLSQGSLTLIQPTNHQPNLNQLVTLS